MSVNHKIVPVGERPYEWALAEYKSAFKGKKVNLSLDSLVIKPGTHVSLFKKDDESPVIYRVYFEAKDSVIYYEVANFKDMQMKHGEIVKLLLNNGKAAYDREMEMRVKFEEETGKKPPHYEPLFPIK
jgi:hypothetical protein